MAHSKTPPPRQNLLFDTAPEQWELDASTEQRAARVVFAEGAPGEYDYAVPDRLRGQVQPGRRLQVPLGRGNRPVVGYCVDVADVKASRPLKEVQSVIDDLPLLTPSMLRVTRWMSEYYLCPWGQVLQAVLPAGVRFQAGTREVTLLRVAAEVVDQLAHLKLPEKQLEALRALAASAKPLTAAQLAAVAKCSTAPIHALIEKKLITTEVRRVQQGEFEVQLSPAHEPFIPNADQQVTLNVVLAALRESRHETILIHGVTGSGKTEVYIRAIEEVVSYGRQAIVLVPEISLTPQTRERFRARFPSVAVLHSHLSDAERHWHWQRIARGETQVVVGARSAVFAPVPHLGLIVLDEEHDGSFKQDSAPRYHARDVALERARLENVPLVLGSATPAIESFQRAKAGEYTLVSMPRRVFDRPLPDVVTIDLRTEFQNRRQRGAVSRQLELAIDHALKNDGQVILLLNRRGFSTHIQCPACGEAVKCPHCALALTHHRTGDKAVCHYCDYQIASPNKCPDCGFLGIQYSGLGTQKLEVEVKSRFPNVACLRMDSDSMQKPGAHEEALDKFRRGDVKILLGTQMIAKGLDFPHVTLVGVVNADTALHLPDFRAAERTFQLVTQVAGRTGRGDAGGRVLVQTFSPEHPSIVAAARHDYLAFANLELPTRSEHGYPPFAGMIRIIFRGPVQPETEAYAKDFGQHVQSVLAAAQVEARVLGPAEAPIAKLRDLFRFHILLVSRQFTELRAAVARVMADAKPPQEIQFAVDVDPLDMM